MTRVVVTLATCLFIAVVLFFVLSLVSTAQATTPRYAGLTQAEAQRQAANTLIGLAVVFGLDPKKAAVARWWLGNRAPARVTRSRCGRRLAWRVVWPPDPDPVWVWRGDSSILCPL
jgi:uncharacterized membrane protein